MITEHEGILVVNKPRGKTSFSLVSALRRRLGVQKIGHAGTLDPFATGVMVMLVGKKYTRLSDQFLNHDKEYIARLLLGVTTDSYDCEGQTVSTSAYIPTLTEIQEALKRFQGEIDQIPPMFSAKKINGKKLCDLARKGKTVERKAVKVTVRTDLLHYEYPYLDIQVSCSKGTYIRSIAHDLGLDLKCGAHLTSLQRIRSGAFKIGQSIDGNLLEDLSIDLVRLLVPVQANKSEWKT
jgi:tRNA pseudouridine55 synthase